MFGIVAFKRDKLYKRILNIIFKSVKVNYEIKKSNGVMKLHTY